MAIQGKLMPKSREVDDHGNCSKCGGIHYDSLYCPFTSEDISKMNEQEVEQEIQDKKLTAPRLTPGQIDNTIHSVDYHVFYGVLTVCALKLRNGFTVTGESGCVSPENFDEGLGRKIALDNARQKIWALEGYLLRESLAASPKSLPEDHEDRVRAEKEDLDGKISRLNSFIQGSPFFFNLDTEEQVRLKTQADLMRLYSNVLADRIKAFTGVTHA